MWLKNRFALFLFRRKWRCNNAHNFTSAQNIFSISSVKVGNNTYGGLCVVNYNNVSKLIIKNYCSIAPEVVFILDGDHYTDHISTYPFKAQLLKEGLEGVSKGNIVVDDDVWIGYRATIMSGVHIGQGAVVAAGAVVTKDIPPYAIAGGIPAKVIRYRFHQEMIEELLKVDYDKLTKGEIEKHIDALYVGLTNRIQLEWMPKKQN